MVVRSNINSMNANRNLSKNNSVVAKSIEKLASGFAINRAADDASGLAITEKMQAQITGLDQGTDNALEGVGLVQTAEGAMSEIHDMLNRIIELSTKSANGTIQDEVDREAIQAEVTVLTDEIDRIAVSTNYNGIPLLDGTLSDGGLVIRTSTANELVSGGTVSNSSNNIIQTYNTGVKIPVASDGTYPISGSYTTTGTDGVGVDYLFDLTSSGWSHIPEQTASAVKISFDDYQYSNHSGVYFEYSDGATNQIFSAPNASIDMTDINSVTSSLNQLFFDEGFEGYAYNNGSNVFIQLTDGDLSNTFNFLQGSTLTSAITINGIQWSTTPTDVTYEGVARPISQLTNGVIAVINGVSYHWSQLVDTSLTVDEQIEQFVFTMQNVYNEPVYFQLQNNFYGTSIISAVTENITGNSFDFEPYVETDDNADTAVTKTETEVYNGEELILHVADQNQSYNKISVIVDSMRAEALLIKDLIVSDQESAGAAIDIVKNAINYVSTNRCNLGALQNRLEHTVNGNNSTSENMTSAKSRIKDCDMAKEMMEYTKMNVLTQASQAMLAQSNQSTQQVLSLLE